MSPVNGAEVLNTEPLRLVFGNASSNSERKFWYVVELAADAGFTTKLYTAPRVEPASGEQTSVLVDARLGTDATYYWRVKADDGANSSSYSSTAHFDIVVPLVIDPPTPVSPVNGETTADNTPNLVVANGRVEGRVGQVDYRYEIATDQAFANIVSLAHVARSGGSTTTHPSAALPSGTLLFWRVRGGNGSVTSPYSATQSFRTPAAPAPGPGPGPGPSPGPVGDWRSCGSTPGDNLVACVHAAVDPAHTEEGAFEVTKRVAWLLRGQGAGLLIKEGGENIVYWNGRWFSAGRIVYPNGHLYKLLGDIPSTNSPQWHDEGIDPGLIPRWVAPMDPGR
jgi:hypothetical protein